MRQLQNGCHMKINNIKSPKINRITQNYDRYLHEEKDGYDELLVHDFHFHPHLQATSGEVGGAKSYSQ